MAKSTTTTTTTQPTKPKTKPKTRSPYSPPELAKSAAGSANQTLRGVGGGLYDVWQGMFGDPNKVAGFGAAAVGGGKEIMPSVGAPKFSAPSLRQSKAGGETKEADVPSAELPTEETDEELQLQPLINPLALQAFYQQVLGPYLGQIAQRQQGFLDTYDQQMGQVLSGNLPSQYRNVLQAQVPQQRMAYGNLFNALAAGATSGPAYSAMLGRISDYANATQKLYFQNAGGGAGSDPTGLMAILTNPQVQAALKNQGQG